MTDAQEGRAGGRRGPPAVRAVLFDMDGVLVDTYAAWFEVLNAAAAEFGRPLVGRDEFASIFGQGTDAVVARVFPGRTRAEAEAAYGRAWERLAGRVARNPEAHKALDALAACGVGRACVTNTDARLVPAQLRAAGLEGRFDSVQGARAGVRDKPAPDLLLAALRDLRAAPGASVMLGDSRFDRDAAAAAGVPYRHYDLRSGASLLAALREAGALRT